MRPPVLWADTSVEQIRHRLRTEFNHMSQQDIRDGFDDALDDGMAQFLQFRGGLSTWIRNQPSESACAQHKPCYNRARLETPQPSVKRKNTFPAAHQQPYLKIMSSDAQVYLKIGDVARLVGISPSAIRGWEALGLTHPHRTDSRYRLYTNDDVRLLKKARYLRKVRGLNAAPIVQP